MRRILVGAALVVVLALSSACSVVSRDLEPETPNPSRQAAGPLMVVDWGIVDGLLSVRLVNDTDRNLERAKAEISVVRADGLRIGAGGAESDDLCCTVLSLPPGGHFGLYVDLGIDADQVADVEVNYTEVAWSPPREEALTALTTRKATLVGGETNASVTALVTSSDEPVDAAAGQAFLNGPDGEFLAVVSGRFSCFSPDRPREVMLELYHPVPDGTTVESVVAYPLSDLTTTEGATSCSR